MVLGAIAGGCEWSPPPSTASPGEGPRLSSVVRITHPAIAGSPLAWRMDTLAVVGDILGGDDAYTFHNVGPGGIAGDGRGNLYVLDGSAGRVLSYDTAGRHRATYGRRGRGPGEIMRGRALALGAGDTIWVLDEYPPSRIIGYGPGGVPGRVVLMPESSERPGIVFAVHDGRFVFQYTTPATRAMTFAGSPMPDARRQRLALIGGRKRLAVLGWNGMTLDTLWSIPGPPVHVDTIRSASRTTAAVTLIGQNMRYAPTLRWAPLASGSVAVADNDRYEIRLVGRDGSELFLIERNLPPRPFTEADREAELRSMREHAMAAGDPGTAEAIATQIAGTTFAATVPRIAGLAADDQNRIWVRVRIDDGSGPRIDIYERDGRFVGWLDGMHIPHAFLGRGFAAYFYVDAHTGAEQVILVRLEINTGHA